MRGVSKRKLVVIVDEGHLLSKEMLEEIRFLMNYKMDSENPLALILAGQTELWDKLKMQAYRAIRHRIDIQCFMMPYDFAQTKAYIENNWPTLGIQIPFSLRMRSNGSLSFPLVFHASLTVPVRRH